jgi:hypothetical protein
MFPRNAAPSPNTSSSGDDIMPDIPPFDDYVRSLGRLTAHIDPTAASPGAADIKEAAASLAALEEVTEETLTAWAADHPSWVNVLGLAVGLSQEKLRMTLKDHFDTQGWVTLARTRPADLIRMLETDFDLVRLVTMQRRRPYDFGHVLVPAPEHARPPPGQEHRAAKSKTRLRPSLAISVWTARRAPGSGAVIDAPHRATSLSRTVTTPRLWSPRKASTRPDRNSPTQSAKSRKWPTYACRASTSWP